MSWLSLSLRHRHTAAFELDIRFETAHRVSALFGPSGAGKTSVLSAIAGFFIPQQARIQLAQEVVTDTDQHLHLPPHQRGIGFVFQDHQLFPHLSVADNLRYGSSRRKYAKRQIDFDRVVKVLELESLVNRSPLTLSGGEKQRVALGRALLSRPNWLLLDEPLASLDEALRLRVLDYVERVVHEWDLPTLFVSHDQAAVRRFAEWVIVLSGGRVTATGKPDEALSLPEMLRRHDTTGPVNLLRMERITETTQGHIGHVGDQTLHLPSVVLNASAPVYVQFSPQSVIVSRGDPGQVSARNHLHGIVRQFVEVPHGVFVAVDIGQIVWCELTAASVKEMQLEIGTLVTCLVKTTGLQILN